MPTSDIVLDANPLSLVTSYKTIKIDPKMIQGREDIEDDPLFMKKYLRYLEKKKVAILRVFHYLE